jgi:hypothetical protein
MNELKYLIIDRHNMIVDIMSTIILLLTVTVMLVTSPSWCSATWYYFPYGIIWVYLASRIYRLDFHRKLHEKRIIELTKK